MASTINSDTSNGVVITPDTSGEIELQSAGVTKAKITSSGLQNASGNAITSQAGKNLIINGDMAIDQRNAGALINPAIVNYTVDRWQYYQSQASKGSMGQNAGAITPPTGFTNYLGFTSSSAYSITATDQFFIRQKIEGFNISDLGWGTVNAKTVTLSFWVYSSLTGTFGGALQNNGANKNYPFTYTISSANTWEQKTVTIAGDTTGTWLTDNGRGISLDFSLGTGSTYSATAGAWSSSSFVTSATGATSVVGTNGATFYITGVQLETGTTATPFENLQYGQQLALCQRYFQSSWSQGSAIGSAVSLTTNSTQQSWGSNNAGIAGQAFLLPVTMRTIPTLVVYDMALTTGKVTTLGNGAAQTNNVAANNSSTTTNMFYVRMYANNQAGITFAHTLEAEL